MDMYLKVDSKGWRALAKTARPVIENLLEDQVQEAGWFISLMGRLVEMYPNWACQVAVANRIYAPTQAEIDFSRRVVAAQDAAAAGSRGATSVDGIMVDAAVARHARAILDEVGAMNPPGSAG